MDKFMSMFGLASALCWLALIASFGYSVEWFARIPILLCCIVFTMMARIPDEQLPPDRTYVKKNKKGEK